MGAKTRQSSNVKVSLRPRILLIADVPNWIFERHCKTLQRYLSDDFDITIAYGGQPYDETKYDLIYPLEWNLIKPEQIRNSLKYVTGIRSHLWWPEMDFSEFNAYLASYFQRVHVVSKRLYRIFSPKLPNVVYVTHGVDTQFFTPTTKADLSGHKIKIGWAGNRKSAENKGFSDILDPLSKLPGVGFVYCGYSDKLLTREEMRHFYDALDVYVCASEHEGSNNPLLEAASMERAIITTDNGTVPEYLKNGESALIVERRLPDFIAAVEMLRDQPQKRVELGKKARQEVLNGWDWKTKAEEYRAFFWTALKEQRSIVNQLPVETKAAAMVSPTDFDEELYLLVNTDVAEAVKRVQFRSGWEHYIQYGRKEGRPGIPMPQPSLAVPQARGTSQATIPHRSVSPGAPAPRPADVMLHLQHSDEYFRHSNLDAAKAELRKALDLAPDDPEIIIAYGNLLLRSGDIEAARQQFVMATVLAPDQIATHMNLAAVLVMQKRHAEAQKAVQRALSLDMQNIEALKLIGRILSETDQHRDSALVYMHVLKSKPDDLEAWLILGKRYIEIGDWVSARTAYRRALEIDPSQPVARKALQQIVEAMRPTAELQGQLDKPKIAFAILTHNALEYTQKCLNSIKRNTPIPYQIYLLDNASTDDTPAWLKNQTDPHLHYELSPTNLGVPGGRNRLIRIILPQLPPDGYIVMLDNDIELLEGWADLYLELLSVHPEVGIASAQGQKILVKEETRDLLVPAPYWTAPVDVAQGGFACWLRADMVRSVGFYDENLGLFWHEDDDYCLRALALGYRVYKIQGVPLIHHEHKSGSVRSDLALLGSPENQCYLAYKWRQFGYVDELGLVLQAPYCCKTEQKNIDRERASTMFLWSLIGRSDIFKVAEQLKLNVDEEVLNLVTELINTAQREKNMKLAADLQRVKKHILKGLSRSAPDRLPSRPPKVKVSEQATQSIGSAKSFSPPLFWISHVFNSSGYASVARRLLTELSRQNYPVRVSPLSNITEVSFDVETLRAIIPLVTDQTLPGSIMVFQHPAVSVDGQDWCAEKRNQYPGLARYILGPIYESDRIPSSWVQACNSMDEVWVHTRFNEETFARSGVDKAKLKRVTFHGIDTHLFTPGAPKVQFPGNHCFNFLSIFEWTKRKGWDILLKAFVEEFSPHEDIALNLYVNRGRGTNQQGTAREQAERFLRDNFGSKFDDLPPIHIIEGVFLNDNQMPGLYAGADSFVLPTRGEGWGMPFLEAMAMGLPTIGTNWGGSLEFMMNENSFLIEIEGLKEIDGEQLIDNPSFTGHKWAEPSTGHLRELMRYVVTHYDKSISVGQRGRQDVLKYWTITQASQNVIRRLEEIGQETRMPMRDAAIAPQASSETTAQRYHNLLPLVWLSPVFDPSGYASMARNTLLGLQQMKYPVSISPLSPSAEISFDLDTLRALIPLVTDRLPPGSLLVSFRTPAGLDGYDVCVATRAQHPDMAHYVSYSMFEADRIPASWVEALRSMDEVWVPTHFNRDTYAHSGVDIEKIYCLPTGINTQLFSAKATPIHFPGDRQFNFLSIFEWTKRKGWDILLKAFVEEFSSKEDVALNLVVYRGVGTNRKESAQRQADLFLSDNFGSKRNKLPLINVIEQVFPYYQAPSLYAGANTYVMSSRGEGWGMPYLEAMAMGLPTIGTRWSGNLEFMDENNSFLIDVEGLVPVDASQIADSTYYAGHQWAEPSQGHLRELMRYVFTHHESATVVGQRARQDVTNRWTLSHSAQAVIQRVEAISREIRPHPISPSTKGLVPIQIGQSAPSPETSFQRSTGQPVILGFDARTFYDQDSMGRGIGHYSLYHLQHLVSLRPEWQYILYGESASVPKEIESLLSYPHVKILPYTDYNVDDIDIIHIPDPMTMTPGFDSGIRLFKSQAKKTITFYDLIPYHLEQQNMPLALGRSYLQRLKEIRDDDNLIFAISEYTRQDLINTLYFPPERVITIMAGLNRSVSGNVVKSSQSQRSQVKQKYGITKPFFLYVGSFNPHKNVTTIAESFLRCHESRSVQFVFVGNITHEALPYVNAFKSKNLKDAIYTGFIPRDELEILYQEAIALVFLSRFEGFGFPVLEAMAHGCPVITTNVTSIPEVAGDAALLYDPDDSKGVAEAMVDLLDHPQKRTKMRARGLTQVAKFTWDSVAKKTIAVWEAMLSEETLEKRALSRKVFRGEKVERELLFKLPFEVDRKIQIGFNVIGYVSGNLGIGVTARSVLQLLLDKGYPITVLDLDPGLGRGKYDLTYNQYTVNTLEQLSNPVNLFVLPPADLVALLRQNPALWQRPGYLNVAWSMWELPVLPPEWIEIMQQLDVLVAESEFIRYTYSFNLSNVLTLSAAHPLYLPGDVQPDRFRFGLPEDAVLFLTSFEPHSDIQRKNPFAVIEAFERGLGADPRAWLVIKLNNPLVAGKPHPLVNALHQRCDGNSNIRIIAEIYSYPDVLSLYASCDVFVSLHRAEGLGLGLMEAMLLGKPVIATAWSGNMTFMDHSNSCLVGYRLIPVEGTIAAYDSSRLGPQAVWADPNGDEAAAWMRRLVEEPDLRAAIGRKASLDLGLFQEEARRGHFIEELKAIWAQRAYSPIQKAGDTQVLILKQAQEQATQVDIVIPIYGQPQLLRQCVESVLATTNNAHLILVDDNSPSGDIKALFDTWKEQPRLTLARTKANLGFLGACKAGADLGKAPYILFLNSDTQALEAGWLEKLIPIQDDIAIVGAKLLYPPSTPGPMAGKIQHAGVARDENGVPYHPFLGWNADSPQANQPCEVNAITGACFLVRRQIWDELDGWDPRFGRGVYEDVDLCWQARQKSYRVLYQPAACLYHHSCASEAVGGRHLLYGQNKTDNLEKLLTKWQGVKSDEDIFFGKETVQRWRRARKQINQAAELLEQHQFNQALSITQKAVKTASDLPDVLIGYAQLLAAQGKHHQAAEQIGKALEFAPAHWDARLRLVDEWLAAGLPDKAAAELAQLKAAFPDQPAIEDREAAVAGTDRVPAPKKRPAPTKSTLKKAVQPVRESLKPVPAGTLQMLLKADDLPAALEANQDKLDADLLALVRENANAARADGEVELAEGLDNLAAYIEGKLGRG